MTTSTHVCPMRSSGVFAPSFDREVLALAKAQIKQFGMPTATELRSSSEPCSSPTLAWPSVQARRAGITAVSVMGFRAISN